MDMEWSELVNLIASFGGIAIIVITGLRHVAKVFKGLVDELHTISKSQTDMVQSRD